MPSILNIIAFDIIIPLVFFFFLVNHFETDENIYGDNTNVVLSQAQSQIKKMKILSNDERRAIYESLLLKSVDGKLKQGVTKMVASQFSVSMRTIQRTWKQSKSNGIHVDVSHKRTGNCGCKRVQIDLTEIPEIREIPLR